MTEWMESRIDSSLTPEERRVLSMYRDPRNTGIGRVIRLSTQYALGTGLFVALCLLRHEPIWVLAVYGTFLTYMVVRIVAARKLAGIMPAIIAKFEARIAELEDA